MILYISTLPHIMLGFFFLLWLFDFFPHIMFLLSQLHRYTFCGQQCRFLIICIYLSFKPYRKYKVELQTQNTITWSLYLPMYLPLPVIFELLTSA